jgi:thioredoxin-related protein
MKKILLTFLVAMSCLMTKAQTNFRAIGYDEAIATAKSENKMVFIDFYTDWCGPCRLMSREVFPNKSVGDYMNSHFVCIKINAEKGEGVQLAKTYKIEGYPTFVIINSDKKEILNICGYRESAAFLNEIDRALDPAKKPEIMKERYDKGERTPELVKSYASYLMDNISTVRNLSQEDYDKKVSEINNMVYDYFTSLSDVDRLKHENMFIYQSFINSPFDKPARFMMANFSRFNASDKSDIDSIVSKLYNREVLALLSGSKKYDEAEFSTLKKEIKQFKLDKNGTFDGAFKFIETESKSDKIAYINFCDKNLKTLTDSQVGFLMASFAKHFTDADAATKMAAAKFLRNHIGEQSVDVIYFTLSQIGNLEGREH